MTKCVKMCVKGSSDYALFDGRESLQAERSEQAREIRRAKSKGDGHAEREDENHQGQLIEPL